MTTLLTATAAARVGRLDRESSFKLRATWLDVSWTMAPMPIRQTSAAAEAVNVRVRIVRCESKPNTERSPRISMCAEPCRAAPPSTLVTTLLLVDPDPDEIVAHLLHEAGFIFNLVVQRIRPFIVDPSGTRTVGN